MNKNVTIVNRFEAVNFSFLQICCLKNLMLDWDLIIEGAFLGNCQPPRRTFQIPS